MSIYVPIVESKKRKGPNGLAKLYVSEFPFDGMPISLKLMDSEGNLICDY